MIDENKKCSQCGGRSELGFIPDATHGGLTLTTWVKGLPQRSFWTGLRVDPNNQRFVATYCCESCGYLESYVVRDE